MYPSIEKLQKYVRLEAKNGYDNKAVIGGLASMLETWEADARNDGIGEEIVQAVTGRLRDYARLSPDGRKTTLFGIGNRLKREFPELGKEKPLPAQPDFAPAQETTSAPQQDSAENDAPVNAESVLQQDVVEEHATRQTRVRPPRSESTPGANISEIPIALNAALTVLKGVGPNVAATLEKLGLYTLGDMLYNYPHRYDDYSQLKPIKSLWYGEQVTVIGNIQNVTGRSLRGGRSHITEVVLNDGTGSLRLTWFNQPWLTNRFKKSMSISVSGKIDQYLGRLQMSSPDWELVEVESLHTNRIVPIYSLTKKITQKWLRKQMKEVTSYWSPKLTDHLPESVRLAAKLSSINTALENIHFPKSQAHLDLARERLAFDEIFFLQMGVLRQKRDWQSVTGRIFDIREDWLTARKDSLLFTLTTSQDKAVSDIVMDFGSGRPMNRLLQGDVGSGKTVVAGLAIAMIANANAQAAMMAPTSILAEQHYRSLSKMLVSDEKGFAQSEIRLLVGNTPEARKQEIREGLLNNTIKVVVGTHALIQGPVEFADLQLAIVDEQHRFGVDQRAALREKGQIYI